MVKNILIKSPDEWATTKQACRDESVVYLFIPFLHKHILRSTLMYRGTDLRVSTFYTLHIYIFIYLFI